MTVCPNCHWENDADTGPCAGCGRELPGSASSSQVPEPRPATSDPGGAMDPDPPSAHQASPAGGVLREASAPVPISPQSRSAPRVIEPGRLAPRPVDVERAQAAAAARIAPRDVVPQVRPRTVVVRPAERSTAAGRGEGAGATVAGGVVRGSPLGGDTLTCRTCGRQVPSELHFCRCGTQLSGAAGPTTTDAAADLDVKGMDRSRFDSVQRRANGGRRPRFDEPLSMRTWLFRVLVTVLLLGGIGSQVPPWGADVRGWITERIDTALSSADDG